MLMSLFENVIKKIDIYPKLANQLLTHPCIEDIKCTNEAHVGHETAVVVVMGTAGDCVRRHLAVHVEVSEARPGGTSPKSNT